MSYGPWKNVTSIHFIYFFISILIIRVDSILKLRIFVWFEWSSLFYIIDAIFYEYRFEQFIFSTQTCNFVFIFFLLKYGFAVIRLYWCIFTAVMTKFQRRKKLHVWPTTTTTTKKIDENFEKYQSGDWIIHLTWIEMKYNDKINHYRLVCFSCNICTYSQALDKMPPFDWPSIAAMLSRPLSPISVALPSAGMILPNFIIQWLILSRRLRSTSLWVARRRSSRFLNELNGSMCDDYYT